MGILFSCEYKAYDTGDGEYSYLRSDMVDVTVKDNIITEIVTDDDVTLNIPSGISLAVTPTDTTLRWMLYYNKVDDKTPVSFVRIKYATVLTPRTVAEMHQRHPDFVMKTDTVKVNSVWLSKNNKYLNMDLGLWLGNTTSDNDVQGIGIIKDNVSTFGKGRIFYTLYHDQADIPVGYYTQDICLSVPTTNQDTIDVCIGKTHFVNVKQ